jgi:hypothetical protein
MAMAQQRINEENIEGKVSTRRFDEEGNQISTNHAGWNVEKFTKDNGWKPIFDTPCESRSDAMSLMKLAKDLGVNNEYRVYEALS